MWPSPEVRKTLLLFINLEGDSLSRLFFTFYIMKKLIVLCLFLTIGVISSYAQKSIYVFEHYQLEGKNYNDGGVIVINHGSGYVVTFMSGETRTGKVGDRVDHVEEQFAIFKSSIGGISDARFSISMNKNGGANIAVTATAGGEFKNYFILSDIISVEDVFR